MGIDAFLFCMTCDKQSDCIGRAYNYLETIMNKQLSKELMEGLILIHKRFEMSLKQIDFFNNSYSLEFHDDIIEFFKEHLDHKVFLLNDFSELRKHD